MAANIEAVRVLAKNYADDVRKILPVTKVYLFGSYAKGSADELSGIDMCFFLETFNSKQRTEIIFELLTIAGNYKGVFFEPLAFPVSEIQRDNPFVREILATGIEM
ncbi:MAG: nucleotidyltransferase domain-containing protein [Spirochaetaceae bacterium]|jgi:predicted nucleotidyltransferase|nr:nucleotidyltransferase domain-containing protein [Spirochaetaceae bacterium]